MVKDYGMFTEAGNTMVDQIVKGAQYKNLNWRDVYSLLLTISQMKGYEEAMDTVVREEVYSALGFETDFYI